MIVFLAGLVLFLGTHSVSIVAPSWRDRIARRLGVGAWQAIYSVVALLGLILVIRGYADLRGQTAVLYQLPRWTHAISSVLMLPVFPLLLAAYLPGALRTAARHPMIVATKLWAVAHLIANGTLADVVLFGSVLVWAGAYRVSIKYRQARAVRALLQSRWNDVIAVVGGLLLYALMFQLGHRWLIGVPLVLR